MESSSNWNLKYIFLTIVLLIVISILALLYLPIVVVRYGVALLAKLLRKDLDSLILSSSSMIATVDDVYGQPRANILIALFVERGDLSLEKLRNAVNSTIHLKNEDGSLKFKEMKQHYQQWLGFMFYQWDENFDINDHGNIYNFNGQSDYECSENDLCQIISEIQTRSWKRLQSPWEFWLIPKYREHPAQEGKSGTEKSVIIMRTHHGLADGYALINFMRNLSSDQYTTPKPHFPKKNNNFLPKLMEIFSFPLRAAYDIGEELCKTRDENQLHSQTKKTTGLRHVAISERISINDIKSIMENSGVSFHAVVCAALSGAIRRHLISRNMNSNIPEYMHAIMPVPFPGHTLRLTNHFSFNYTKFPVGESSAAERLKLSEFHHKTFQRSPLTTAHFYVSQFLGGLFCAMTKFLTDRLASTTALFTNFAGPSNNINVPCGYPVHDIMFAADAINSHTGLSFSFLSYNGNIRLVVLADKSIIPEIRDVKQIPTYIKEEIEVLKAIK